MTSLVSLDLYLNNFSGPITDTLGRLTKLRFLCPPYSSAQVINSYTEKFDIPESSKGRVMDKLNRRWKDNKHDLKTNFYDRYSSDSERRANIDLLRMSTAQWDAMFKMWNDEKFQAMSERNKENKSQMKMHHTTGNTPFPVIRERMRIEDPNLLPPTRMVMFEKTYTSKNTGAPLDPKSAERLESLKTRLSNESEDRQKDKDVQESIFQEVMGRDHHGRVRMFGGGVTPKDVIGTQTMRDQKRAEEMAHLREENCQLKEEMAQQRAKLTEMETQMRVIVEFMRSSQSSE